MYKNFRIKLSATVLFAAIISAPQFASAQTVPTSAQPGVIMRNIKEEQRTPSYLKDIVTVNEDQASGKGLSDKKVFKLNSVIIDNSTVYDQNAVNLLLADYLGQEVSFRDLNSIGNLLTKKYRDDGYIFSRVILVPQKVKEGVVHFKAVEGKISGTKVTGNFKDNNGLVAALVEKIKSAGPSNSKTIERYLLLIDDLPGLKARSFLQPSQDVPGGVDMVINIEQDDFEGSVSVDNRGSKYVGPVRGTLVGAFNSLFGIHDRTTLRGIASADGEEMRFGDITHEEQVGTEGAKVKGRFAFTGTKPGANISNLYSEGVSRLYDLEGEYPLVRSRNTNLNLIAGFNALDATSEVLSTTVSEDRVRSVRAGVHYDFTDTLGGLSGVNQIDTTITQGVDVFNATKDGTGRTRINGEHDFTRFNANLTRVQGLFGDFSVQLSASGQYSADPLLVSEEFSVGGSEFGRAYDSGEISGDSGLDGLIELRYGKPLTDVRFLEAYQLYAFYDVGKVWNENVVVGEVSNAALSSAGVGVRFNLNKEVTTDVQLSKPLTRDVDANDNDDYRLFFNITKRF